MKDAKEYTTRHNGIKETRDEHGRLHSFDDNPSVIHQSGSKYWHKNGECHRDDDKPAILYHDGSKFWYKNGRNHRDNGEPAIIWDNGDKYWYIEDVLLTDKQVILLKRILTVELKELPWLINEDPLLNCLIEKRLNEE